MADVEISELDELAATKVSGVAAPANGTRFIVLKAADDNKGEKDCPTCDGKGTILDGNRDCPDCKGSGTVAKTDASGGTDDDDASDDEDAVQQDAEKALSAKDRDAMPNSSFAYIDKDGGKHLPIHDEGHVRSALGRISQQDFSNAKGDPDKAKAAAQRKINAAAKKHGIDLAEKTEAPIVDPIETAKAALATASNAFDEVLYAAKVADLVAKSPGVPDNATDVPLTVAKIPSGMSDDLNALQPATDGEIAGRPGSWPNPNSLADVTTPLEGGESAYKIPLEAQADLTKAEEIITVPGISWAVASLSEAIQKLGEQRALIGLAAKAGLSVAPPKPEESAMPGDMPWENYDSATAAQIAGVLAEVCAAVECLINREQMEATTVDPSDADNAYDLQSMQQAIQYALGIVAQFSFTEAAEASKELDEGAAVKAGRRLSGKTESVLRAARDHLTSVIGDGDDQQGSEEDIMATLTKEELGDAIVTAYERLEAKKNANNGGDIDTAALHPNGTIDEDLSLAGKPSGLNGSDYGTVGKSEDAEDTVELLKAMKSQLDSLGEQVEKFSKQPRRGGPILDGQARVFAAGEGREGSAVKASEVSPELAPLLEQFTKAQQVKEKTGDGSFAEQAGQALTMRALELHNQGLLTPADNAALAAVR